MSHIFSDAEYSKLREIWRREGVAEGVFRANERMGEVLDQIAHESRHRPYLVPYWVPVKPMTYDDALRPPDMPKNIELTRDQIMAIRVLLCGQPTKEVKP